MIATRSSPSLGGVNDSPRSASGDRPLSFANWTAAVSATAASDPLWTTSNARPSPPKDTTLTTWPSAPRKSSGIIGPKSGSCWPRKSPVRAVRALRGAGGGGVQGAGVFGSEPFGWFRPGLRVGRFSGRGHSVRISGCCGSATLWSRANCGGELADGAELAEIPPAIAYWSPR